VIWLELARRFALPLAILAAVAAGLLFAHHRGYAEAEAEWQSKWSAQAIEQAKALDTERQKAAAIRSENDRLTAKIDSQHEALQNAQANNETLRRDLAAGAVRVRFSAAVSNRDRTGTKNPAATSMDDGKTGCELDGTTAQSLVGIASDGDSAIRKLNALQDYVSDVVLKTCG